MTSDIDKIRQILVALAGNAVKFTEAGAIRLELERKTTATSRFTVRDTGIGIGAMTSRDCSSRSRSSTPD